MKNLKEYLEKRIDMPTDGFIIETPYINTVKAEKYETNGLHLLRSGSKTKFYAATAEDLGDFITKLATSTDLEHVLLSDKNDSRIIIYKAENNINDSVRENNDYINENRRNNTPLQKRKAEITKQILAYELPRTEKAIRTAFEESGSWTSEWNSKSALMQNNHIKMVMKNTEMLDNENNTANNDNIDDNEDNTINSNSLETLAANAPIKTIKLSVIYSSDEYVDQNEASYMFNKYKRIFNPIAKFAPYITYKFKIIPAKATIAFISFPDIMPIKLYIANSLFTSFFGGKMAGGKEVAEQDVMKDMLYYLDINNVLYDGKYEDFKYLGKHLLDLICDAMDLYGLFTEGTKYTKDQLDENTGDFMTMDEYLEDQEEYQKIISGYYDDVKSGDAVHIGNWHGTVDGD